MRNTSPFCNSAAEAADQLPPKLHRRWGKLEAKIRKQAGFLTDQGALASYRVNDGRVWAVRFYEVVGGRKIQRSIYVGDDEHLLRRTRELLEELRRPSRRLAEVRAMSQLGRVLMRAVRQATGTRRRSPITSHRSSLRTSLPPRTGNSKKDRPDD